MSELTQITLTEPVVKPAETEEIYDKLWLTRLSVNSFDPKDPIDISATLAVCKDTQEGKKLKSPTDEINIDISDLFSVIADESLSIETRTALTQALDGLLNAITLYGKETSQI